MLDSIDFLELLGGMTILVQAYREVYVHTNTIYHMPHNHTCNLSIQTATYTEMLEGFSGHSIYA